jgi:hypothetical protein
MADFNVGDKVKLLPFYLDRYVDMNRYADKEAEVMKIRQRNIAYKDLLVESGDRQRFVEKYGKLDTYPLIEMWVKYPDDNAVFVVSTFGYGK